MKTMLKWPGGKEQELPIIKMNMPNFDGRYIEPFVGGGAVYFDLECEKNYINDKSDELINLYNSVKNKDKDFEKYLRQENEEFISIGEFVDNNKQEILDLYKGNIEIEEFIEKHKSFYNNIAKDYNNIFMKELYKNLSGKIKRSNKLENENGNIPDSDRIDNMESAMKSAYYMYVRYLQNNKELLSNGRQAAVFYFVREYCYSSMFRYNAKGDFNVPYGGISYNRKDFSKKINYVLSDEMNDKLKGTMIYNDDFESFIDKIELNENDFMFLDPPYDTDFSTYANNAFDKNEQIRLCECLKKTKSKFMLVIKNTDFIYDLYKNDFYIKNFDKKYMVSFKNRNDREVEHLIITNYKIEDTH